MLADIKPVIEEELNKYWRRQAITILLPESLLLLLWHDGLKDGLVNAVVEHNEWKEGIAVMKTTQFSAITTEELDEWIKTIEYYNEQLLKPLNQKVHDYICNNREEQASRCEKSIHTLKKGLLPLLHSSKEFEAEIRNRRDKQYVQKPVSGASVGIA